MCSLRVSSLLMTDLLVAKTNESVWTITLTITLTVNQALKLRSYPIPQTRCFFA